jgi:hypothetical protein
MMPIYNIGILASGSSRRTNGLLGAIEEAGAPVPLFSLDAGDLVSYAAGQTWTDQNAVNSFYRGAGSGSEGSDPTFNGTPGALSANEYWSFDAGDYFTSINPNPCEAFHKNNAAWSVLVIAYFASYASPAQAASFIGDASTTFSGTGFIFNVGTTTSSRTLGWGVNNGAGVAGASRSSSLLLSAAPSWNIFGMSLDEAAGPGGSFFFANGSTETFDGTYTSPSAGSSSGTLGLGAHQAATGSQNLSANQRLAAIAAFPSALSVGHFNSIFADMRGRFGL